MKTILFLLLFFLGWNVALLQAMPPMFFEGGKLTEGKTSEELREQKELEDKEEQGRRILDAANDEDNELSSTVKRGTLLGAQEALQINLEKKEEKGGILPQPKDSKGITTYEKKPHPNKNFNMSDINTINKLGETAILAPFPFSQEGDKISEFRGTKIEVKNSPSPIIPPPFEKILEREGNKPFHEITQVVSWQEKSDDNEEARTSEESFGKLTPEEVSQFLVDEKKGVLTVESTSITFPSRLERNEILKQAVAGAEELIKHGKDIREATHPISDLLLKARSAAVKVNDAIVRDLIDKEMEAINNFTWKINKETLPAINDARAEIEKHLTDICKNTTKENLEKESHHDAILLTRLKMASAAFEKVTQETAATTEDLMRHERYRGALADQALVPMRALEAKREGLFSPMNKLAATLPLLPVDPHLLAKELKKEKLKQSIKYAEVLSQYAKGLEDEGLGGALCNTIYDCGDGTILDNDTQQILKAEYKTLGVLAMSEIATAQAKQYLEAIGELGEKPPISPQEEAQLFASVEVTTSLLKDTAEHLGKTLNELYKKYQEDWPSDEKEEKFLTLLKSAEAPYQAFIESKKE